MRQKLFRGMPGTLAVVLLFALWGCNGSSNSPTPPGNGDPLPPVVQDPLPPVVQAPLPPGILDPAAVPKFVTPLAIPGTMPNNGTANTYEIEVAQFKQQILPVGLPQTTVWSYGAVGLPETRHYPARSIEATVNTPVTVTWINNLKDAAGNFLPHLLPVDQTLHWANPPQTCFDEATGGVLTGTDCAGRDQAPYTGPVPIITHLHGAHVGPDSDGFPTAWYLPAAKNIPAGFATRGSHFGQIAGAPGLAGQATFRYRNDQAATTLWYHDHTVGMTRLNVYAGLAGFYLLRGGPGDIVDDTSTLVVPGDGVLPAGAFEIPLLIQDRTFKEDGSLFYPDNRAFFEGLEPAQLKIPFFPDATLAGATSDVSPIWNAEFFGNTLVVNGNTWPFLNVEPRQYRLRFLNGSDSRFLILTTADAAGQPLLTFRQIGADGGFLPQPAALSQLLIAPAERADVIVDFSALAGQTITLRNFGPDEPFGGGTPFAGCGVDPAAPADCFEPANPATTGQVMQFRVAAQAVADPSTPVVNLGLPAPAVLGAESVTRRLSLNEAGSATVFVPVDATGAYILDANGNLVAVPGSDPAAAPFGPTEGMLGILDGVGNPVPLEFMAAITENPTLGATEVWEIYNFTADAHPIHIHLVQFEIINRQALVTDAAGTTVPAALVPGTERLPEPGETGRKDTIIVYPGEVARVKAVFDIPGLFVWHCHILSHEDNEMMRPFEVVVPLAP
jgi:spore coat protein A, manganese oxidase